MKGPVIRAFEASDLAYILPRPHDVRLAAALPDILERVKEQAKLGPAMTGLYDGVPVFCGGIVVLWPGVGEGWLYVSEQVAGHRLSFHRAVREWIGRLCADWKLHRLQVAIPDWNGMSCRWIKRLGFAEEGPMRGYGPDGSTFIRYAMYSVEGRA